MFVWSSGGGVLPSSFCRTMSSSCSPSSTEACDTIDGGLSEDRVTQGSPRDDEALLAHFDSVLDSAVSSSSSVSPQSLPCSPARPPLDRMTHRRSHTVDGFGGEDRVTVVVDGHEKESPRPFMLPSSTTTPFSLLSEMFSNLPAHAIRAALNANGGDPSAAAAALAAPSPPDDAALARKLQDIELALADEEQFPESAHPRQLRNLTYAPSTNSRSLTSSRASSNAQRSRDAWMSRFSPEDFEMDVEHVSGTAASSQYRRRHRGTTERTDRRPTANGRLPETNDRSSERGLSGHAFVLDNEDDDQDAVGRAVAHRSDRVQARSRARERSTSTRENGHAAPLSSTSSTVSSAAQGFVNRRRPHGPPTLTPAMRQEVLSALKHVIVPSLHAHFEEITFGDYEEVQPGYVVTLQDVAVSALSLTPDSIKVRAVAGGFRVNVVNVFLELEIGQWLYHSKSFFGFKDSGHARVIANGLSASAMLLPRLKNSSDIGISVGDVEVSIDGVFRLRTQGSAADWAYNAAAVLLKPLVVSYVKEAVREVIFNTLAAQLIGWTAWTSQPSRSCNTDVSRNSGSLSSSDSITSMSSDFLAVDGIERSRADDDRIVPSSEGEAFAR